MDLISMISEGGPLVYVQLMAFLAGTVVAAVAGGLLLANKRFPPAVLALILSLVPFAAVVSSLRGRVMAMEAVAHASPEMKQTLLAAGIVQGLYPHAISGLLVALPVLLILLMAGVAGVLRGPRRLALPLVVGGLTLVLCGAAVASGLAQEYLISGLIKAVVYALAGLAVALSLAGRDPRTSAPLAGATAAAILPLLVACVEASSLANQYGEVFMAVAHASAEMKSTLLLAGLELAGAGLPWAWVALVLASVVGVLGVVSATAPEQPGRNAGVLVALVTVLVGPLLLVTESTPLLVFMSLQFG